MRASVHGQRIGVAVLRVGERAPHLLVAVVVDTLLLFLDLLPSFIDIFFLLPLRFHLSLPWLWHVRLLLPFAAALPDVSLPVVAGFLFGLPFVLLRSAQSKQRTTTQSKQKMQQTRNGRFLGPGAAAFLVVEKEVGLDEPLKPVAGLREQNLDVLPETLGKKDDYFALD